MKRFLTMVFVVITSCVFSSLSAADPSDGMRFGRVTFFGLWEGIDAVDGSGMQRSITQDPDGTLRVVGRETFFSFCNGEPGIIVGTGVIDHGRLYVEDQRLKCSGGSEIDISAIYELNRRDDTLIETPYDLAVEPLVYHQISRRR